MSETKTAGPPVIIISAKRVEEAQAARAAVENHARTPGEWVKGELRWGAGQFCRVLVSVVVVRGMERLFRAVIGARSAFDNADALLGKAPAPGVAERPKGYSYVPPKPAAEAPPEEDEEEDDEEEDEVEWDEDREPRRVATVGDYTLWDHNKVIVPQTQEWPCPLRYRTPCDSCVMREEHADGTPECAARVKLQELKLGRGNKAEDFLEIKKWIRATNRNGEGL